MEIKFSKQGSSVVDVELFERVLNRWEASVKASMSEGFTPPETLVLGLSAVIDEVCVQMYQQYEDELKDRALSDEEFDAILNKEPETPETTEETQKPKLKLM